MGESDSLRRVGLVVREWACNEIHCPVSYVRRCTPGGAEKNGMIYMAK